MLAARVVMEQGVEVLGVAFVMAFAARDVELFKRHIMEAADDAKIPVRIVDISDEFLEVIKDPKYGIGANLNPCIDCRILMLKHAKRIMEAEGAGFVITGEVLGERPMSQRKGALELIKNRSSLEGYLLRPLSAKVLEKTIPEEEGIVEREKLLDIVGRSREPQLKLAKKYNLHKYFTPAGGCLLTDPIFSRKLKDLIEKEGWNPADIDLLKYGRHFRLDDGTKVVVGRDERDNESLLSLKTETDIVVRLKDKAGPYVLLRGDTGSANIEKAAALAISHSKSRNEAEVTVEFWKDRNNKSTLIARALPQEEIERMRV